MNRARWFLAVGLSTSCVPVDQLTVPDDIDWLAFVGARVEGYEDGRLYPADEVDRIAAPTSAGWLIGYRAEQLAAAGLQEQLTRVFVRLRASDDPQLPQPAWDQSFFTSDSLPELTSSSLPPPPQIGLDIPMRLNVRSEIVAGGFQTLGPSDDGTLLLAVHTGRLYRIGLDDVTALGRHGCEVAQSIVIHLGRMWIRSTDGSICSGPSAWTLEFGPPMFDGTFHIDGRNNLYYVTWFGSVFQPTSNFRLLFDSVDFGERSEFRVASDANGELLAAGRGWSIRSEQSEIRPNLGIEVPFAAVDEGVAFASEGKEIHLRYGDVLDGVLFLSDGTPTHKFESVVDMASFAGGLVVSEGDGQLYWVSLLGGATEFYRLAYPVQRMVRFKDTLLTFSIVESDAPSGSNTVVTRFSLTP